MRLKLYLPLVIAVLAMTVEPGHSFTRWSGDRPIGKLERQCYERHERDLSEARARGLWFDEAEAERVCNLFPKYFRHSEGEWFGERFDLMGWERFVVSSVFGWKRLPPGVTVNQAARIGQTFGATERQRRLVNAGVLRRFRRALVEVPKKSGKSPLNAGIGIIGLCLDGEPGAQVYSFATKRDQAKIIYELARRTVFASPELSKHLNPLRTAIACEKTWSTFKPMSAQARTEDGMNPHFALVDELHRHANPEMVQLLIHSFGARRQPLMFATTTAGEPGESVWKDWHEEAEKALSGVVESDSFFAFIAQADEGDDWQAVETHKKANPSYGITISAASIAEECAAAQRTPRLYPDFMRFRLNRPMSLTAKWMDMDKWRDCGDTFTRESLKGRACYLGLDLSTLKDLTALAAVFPPMEGDTFWRVLTWGWVPTEAIHTRATRDRVPYDVWVRDGFLTATPGAVVDYAFIEETLTKLYAEFEVMECAFDPHNATKFYTDWINAGHAQVVMVTQCYTNLSPAMKEIDNLVVAGKLRHQNNPVFNWCMSNTIPRTMPSGDIMPDKKKSGERIDFVSAMVTAMSRACLAEDTTSVYSGRGFIAL